MLSHYRLVEKIGEGGMGVVWEAEDTALARRVAIKILPDVFAGDPERLARFEREARLLASLEHVNIAAVYDLADTDGVRCLILELVPGRTLAELVEAGPLPVDEILRLALQIAEALEAAHEVGVIHRDLKPANIKVTPEERVKVLDFGLAKAFEVESPSPPSAADLSHSPTVTSGGTRAGVILGTAGYMSPEQARGKRVDKRTDIWAFGCVLYELLTGKQLFQGETVSDTLAAVLRAEPEWSLLPEETPASVRRLLRRCLQKNPRQRLRDVGDARITIQETLAGETTETGSGLSLPAATPSPGSSLPQKILLASAGILVGAALSFAGLWGWGASLFPPEPPLRRLELPAASSGAFPVISPDGRSVAYAENGRLWVHDLDELEPREIPGSEAARAFWSPDSNWIGFDVGGELFKVSADGGTRMSIGPVKGGIDARSGGAAWLEDGTIVYTTGSSGLLQIAARGGEPVPLLEPVAGEMDFHNVSPLPGGRGVVFTVHREGGMDTIATFSGGKRKDLFQLHGQALLDPWYSPTGHLVYSRVLTNPGLWAVPFSLGTLEVTGDPFLVVDGGQTPSISGDGVLVYRYAQPVPGRLVWVDRDGGVESALGQPLEGLARPALSPDGQRIVASARQGGNVDLWVYDLASDATSRLTFDDSQDFLPSWMPDGERVIYTTLTHGDATMPVLTIMPVDGSGESRELGPGIAPCVSSDGKYLAYMRFGGGGNLDVSYMSLDGPSEPVPVMETGAMEQLPRISPDGRYLAYQSDASGRFEIYLTRFPDGTGRWQVSSGGGTFPRWGKSSGKLFYVQDNDLMEVEVAKEPALWIGTPRKLFSRPSTGGATLLPGTRGFDVAGDGERFLMVENTDPGGAWSRIMVIQNWFAAFRDRK
jgi:Tol biopolymer transport system component